MKTIPSGDRLRKVGIAWSVCWARGKILGPSSFVRLECGKKPFMDMLLRMMCRTQ